MEAETNNKVMWTKWTEIFPQKSVRPPHPKITQATRWLIPSFLCTEMVALNSQAWPKLWEDAAPGTGEV